MRSSQTTTLLLILALAGLGFGQADRPMPQGGKADAKVRTKAPAGMIKPVPFAIEDSMQCLMGKFNALTAAYTEAAASGCKKVKAGQWSEYLCDDNSQCGACMTAQQKIQTILNNCRLKPPQHTPAPPDGLGIPNDVPGCNSLGIQCVCPSLLFPEKER